MVLAYQSPAREHMVCPRPLVLAHGCFDLLHLGHIRHLREARQLGAWLTVSVTSDRFVNKGEGRPHFTAEQRAEALRALGCVDEVVINDAADAAPMIAKLRPDIFVKGPDYATRLPHGTFGRELAVLEQHGGKFVTTKTDKWSSSRLLNAETLPLEVLNYLGEARRTGFLDRIEQAFEKVRKMRVLMVGETITDQYVFVSPLSKPSKEFVLAASEEREENYLGGVQAAAAHLKTLCEVEVITQPVLMPLRKRRYVEQGLTRKLFETYSPARLSLTPDQRADILLDAETMWNMDCAIVLDFGHGLIDKPLRDALRKSKFLAANAQTNAGNQGFNLVTKYEGADYICVDAPEARLAIQDQGGSIENVITQLAKKTSAQKIIVTHGREGAYWRCGRVPAITTKPIDTMGAGDCFLAFTAPLMCSGLDEEAAALVGNIAAGIKTGIVGHRQPVDGNVLLQTVRSYLQ